MGKSSSALSAAIKVGLSIGEGRVRRRTIVVVASCALLVSAATGAVPTAAHAAVVSTATGAVTTRVGQDPEVAAVSPDGSKLYVANQGSGTVSVVSPSSKKVVATIRGTSQAATAMVSSTDGKTVYVGNGGEETVSVIQTSTDRVIATVDVGTRATVLSLSSDGTRLDIGDTAGNAAVLMTATRKVVVSPAQTLNLNGDIFSPDGSKEYGLVTDASGEDSVDTLSVATGAVLSSVAVGSPAFNPCQLVVAANGKTAAVVVPSGYRGGAVEIVDLAAEKVDRAWSFSDRASDTVAISPTGAKVAVAFDGGTSSSQTAVIVDSATATASAEIPIDVRPAAVTFSHDGSVADFLSSGTAYSSGSLTRIPVATPTRPTLIGVGENPVDVVENPTGASVFVLNSTDDTVSILNDAPAGWRPTVTRISGSDRYATSIAISQATYPGAFASTNAVYIASGQNFYDAMMAAPIASWDGPLLLTPPGGLTPALIAELKRLHPSEVYLIGGTSSISAKVESQAAALYPGLVQRLAGADRYATDVAVDSHRYPFGHDGFFIVNGENYPDALSTVTAARGVDAPMLLVDGPESQLGDATKAYIQHAIVTSGNDPATFTIVGGTASVSSGIQAELATMGKVTRIAGADRYSTSQLANAAEFPQETQVFFASGQDWEDAALGATLAAAEDKPLYLVPPTCVPDALGTDLIARGTGSITVFGGTAALSSSVAALKRC